MPDEKCGKYFLESKEHNQIPDGIISGTSKLSQNSPTVFPPIPEDEMDRRDSLTSGLDPVVVNPRALVPGATLSPVFLSEEQRTFRNPISYLGGPRLDSSNTTRASKESVLSLD